MPNIFSNIYPPHTLPAVIYCSLVPARGVSPLILETTDISTKSRKKLNAQSFTYQIYRPNVFFCEFQKPDYIDIASLL